MEHLLQIAEDAAGSKAGELPALVLLPFQWDRQQMSHPTNTFAEIPFVTLIYNLNQRIIFFFI